MLCSYWICGFGKEGCTPATNGITVIHTDFTSLTQIHLLTTHTNNLLLRTLYLQLPSAQSVILRLRFSGPIFILKTPNNKFWPCTPLLRILHSIITTQLNMTWKQTSKISSNTWIARGSVKIKPLRSGFLPPPPPRSNLQQFSSSNTILLSSLKIEDFFLLLSFYFMYLRHGSMISKK